MSTSEPKQDPGVHQQEERVDPDERPEVDASGKPLAGETNRADLERGLDYDPDETPEKERLEGHPTPDHPTGRLEP